MFQLVRLKDGTDPTFGAVPSKGILVRVEPLARRSAPAAETLVLDLTERPVMGLRGGSKASGWSGDVEFIRVSLQPLSGVVGLVRWRRIGPVVSVWYVG
jgi:hypothetical protein